MVNLSKATPSNFFTSKLRSSVGLKNFRKHTQSTGARSLDLLHIAFALQLGSELFLSADHCQASVAELEGLDVVLVED